MKSNFLLILGLMSFAFGIYIGMNGSELCFIFMILGIILCLFAILAHKREQAQAPTYLQGPRYR
jgi:hypothetical protein